jgi:uncharacterized membrane protein
VNQRGATSVLAAAMVALTVFAGLIGVEVYRLVTARAVAQTAADAAALAAAPLTFGAFGSDAAPEAEAATFAKANGSVLLDCRCPYDPVWRPRIVVVTVAVEVDSFIGISQVRAVAAAEFDPTVWLTR